MAARLIAFAAAVFLAGFGVIALHDERTCEDRAEAVYAFGFGGKQKISDGHVDELMERCRGSHVLSLAALALLSRDRVDQAARLADEAIRREPGNYEGWVMLARTLRKRGLDDACNPLPKHGFSPDCADQQLEGDCTMANAPAPERRDGAFWLAIIGAVLAGSARRSRSRRATRQLH